MSWFTEADVAGHRHPLAFQAYEEAHHWVVIPVVSTPAHTQPDPVSPQ